MELGNKQVSLFKSDKIDFRPKLVRRNFNNSYLTVNTEETHSCKEHNNSKHIHRHDASNFIKQILRDIKSQNNPQHNDSG